MQSNPIVEKQEATETERRRNEAYRYPFRIVCVIQDADNNDFPITREVTTYCNANNLIIVKRYYDIDKYEEDIFIKRLPAFHIYYKNGHQEIAYYDTDPIRAIQIKVWAFQDEQRAKERAKIRRQERWDSTVESVKSFLSLERFKKKPALDLEASLSHSRDSVKPEKESVNQTENTGKHLIQEQ